MLSDPDGAEWPGDRRSGNRKTAVPRPAPGDGRGVFPDHWGQPGWGGDDGGDDDGPGRYRPGGGGASHADGGNGAVPSPALPPLRNGATDRWSLFDGFDGFDDDQPPPTQPTKQLELRTGPNTRFVPPAGHQRARFEAGEAGPAPEHRRQEEWRRSLPTDGDPMDGHQMVDDPRAGGSGAWGSTERRHQGAMENGAGGPGAWGTTDGHHPGAMEDGAEAPRARVESWDPGGYQHGPRTGRTPAVGGFRVPVTVSPQPSQLDRFFDDPYDHAPARPPTPPPAVPRPVVDPRLAAVPRARVDHRVQAARPRSPVVGQLLEEPAVGFQPDEGEEFVDQTSVVTRNALEWAVVLVGAVLVALVLRASVFQAFYIPSGSMEHTLLINDRVLVNKVSYHLHDVNRGDVVVFERPANEPGEIRDLIKRVVALPGETLEIQDDTVYIDGNRLVEPYVDEGTPMPDFGPVVVPEGHLFVMGDNRDDSQDSRIFGPIDQQLVVGRAFVLFWPFDRLGSL